MKNRIYKFRAWDKSDNQMYYAIENGIQFDDDSVYEFRDFLMPKENDYHKWIVMQFTRLLDKNGKEIYEGDIIKGRNLEGFYKIKEVIFDKYQWYPFAGHRGYEDFIVIGNIYENKDLLNNN